MTPRPTSWPTLSSGWRRRSAPRAEAARPVRFRIVVVGKPRNAAVADAVRDYEQRAARYWPIDVREVKEESARSVDTAVVVAREWTRLREAATGAILLL